MIREYQEMQKFSVKYFFYFIFCTLLWVSSFADTKREIIGKKPELVIDYLNEETTASCGCFAWAAPAPLTKGKLIFQEIEANKKKLLNVRVDGVVLSLQRDLNENLNRDLPSPKDKFFTSKIGDSFEERLVAPNFVLLANWKTKKISSPQEESARSVIFDVEFKFAFKGRKKNISATGYCGC